MMAKGRLEFPVLNFEITIFIFSILTYNIIFPWFSNFETNGRADSENKGTDEKLKDKQMDKNDDQLFPQIFTLVYIHACELCMVYVVCVVVSLQALR